MAELLVTNVGKAEFLGNRYLLRFNKNGAIIPVIMFDYFNRKDVVKPDPFVIKAGMSAQVITEDGRLMDILISHAFVKGKILPTIPFVEVNLVGCNKGTRKNSGDDTFESWSSWAGKYKIEKIVDERGLTPVVIEIDNHGGII